MICHWVLKPILTMFIESRFQDSSVSNILCKPFQDTLFPTIASANNSYQIVTHFMNGFNNSFSK